MAQHYGLPTDFIDVISNYAIATFFAVCRWACQTQAYLPVRSASKPEVLYRIFLAVLIDGLFYNEKKDDILSHVGWQPMHRPEQQRAFGVRLTKGRDFCRPAPPPEGTVPGQPGVYPGTLTEAALV